MTIEPANEASLIYEEGGPVADGTKTALMPAGPLGTRHVGLYCPPYAIPSLSQSKAAAWELAKFLCAPEQVLADAQESGFVEVSRNSVLNDPAFRSRFRPDLVETTVATRAFARGERPVYGGTTKFQEDPHWRDLILFYEFYHGDNGAGLGASHQTGWSALVAALIDDWRR